MRNLGTNLETDREVIRRHSKSFALASRLLPPAERRRAEALYAWCRAADDAVDHAPGPAAAEDALADLHAGVEAVYAGRPVSGPAAALRFLVDECAIPQAYPLEMLAGFGMDAAGTRYQTTDDLLLYCHRVAGVVGLMMCHAFGVSDDAALPHAADLGAAMQLTNIARDINEDWSRGRLYLPESWLPRVPRPGESLSDAELAPAVRRLLDLAGDYYRSGRSGLRYLSPRCRLAVRVAELVYAAIGREVARGGYRATGPRAYVPKWRKLLLVARAAAETRPSPGLATRPPASIWEYPRLARQVAPGVGNAVLGKA